MDRDLLHWIKKIAEVGGDRVALNDGTGAVSYASLVKDAAIVSAHIRSLGLPRGSVVAIRLETSPGYVAAILGVLYSGCAFAPVSYYDPPERVKKILDDLSPALLIADERVAAEKPGIPSVDLSRLLRSEREAGDRSLEVADSDPKRLAYVIYTSGTTGTPKGVCIRYESLNNAVNESIRILSFTGRTRCLCVSPFYFDAAYASLFSILVCGGTLYVNRGQSFPVSRFTELLYEESISHASCTPSYLALLLDFLKTRRSEGAACLKTLSLGGEDCSKERLRDFFEFFPQAQVFNRYGPSETAIVASTYLVGKEALQSVGKIPIGRPHGNVSFHAFNEQGKPIAPGEKGELYIGGKQVMSGYFNDAALSESVLFDKLVQGQRLYKTGDLVGLTDEGDYLFLGRIDNVVKINGHRVGLSEIEAALGAMEDVKQVLCRKVDGEIHCYLSLYRPGIGIGRVRDMASRILPVYMLPKKIELVGEFALSPTGKIDVGKLPGTLGDKPGPAGLLEEVDQ